MQSPDYRVDKGNDDEKKSPPVTLVGALLKEFVSKDNQNRHEKYAKNQDYATYNAALILKEFLGHKLYSLMAATPKTYISLDENNQMQIHSEKKIGTKTLNDYLCQALQEIMPDKTQIDAEDFLHPERKDILKEAVNKLDGIGVICFMALWLQDFDVFGRALDNILVDKDNTVIKIDTSEINVNKAEHFQQGINALQSQHAYFSHERMPFFLAIYELLDEKQIQAGFNAIYSLSGEDFTKSISWIQSTLGISEQDTKALKEELRDRQIEIVTAFASYISTKTQVLVHAIEQDVVIRPASDFLKTEKQLKGGNSNPHVSLKEISEKKIKLNLLMLSHSIIDLVIKLLQEASLQEAMPQEDNNNKSKETSLKKAIKEFKQLFKNAEDNNKVKESSIKNAIQEFEKLLKHVEKLIYTAKYQRVDIKNIFDEFDKIASNVSKTLNQSMIDKNQVNKMDDFTRLTQCYKEQFQSFFKRQLPVTPLKTQSNKDDIPLSNKKP